MTLVEVFVQWNYLIKSFPSDWTNRGKIENEEDEKEILCELFVSCDRRCQDRMGVVRK